MSGWTDYGDWTSADTLRLNPYMRPEDEVTGGCVEALIRAVNEHSSVCGLAKLYVDASDNITANLFDIKNVCLALHNRITQLIPLFVNTSDLDNLAAWTEAAILAAIAAESRITLHNDFVDANWIWQQKQILAQLTTRQIGYTPVVLGDELIGSEGYGFELGTPAEAQAMAISRYGEWIEGGDTLGVCEGWFDKWGTVNPFYIIMVTGVHIDFDLPSLGGFSATLSLYAHARKLDVDEPSYHVGFDACGLPLVENKYAPLFSVDSSAENTRAEIRPTRPATPPEPPPSYEAPGYKFYDYQSQNGFQCYIKALAGYRFVFAS